MEIKPIYYHDYLQLDKIIKSQKLVSKEWYNDEKHDEMLFIVTHQAFELWFTQILYELKSIIGLLKNPFDDNSEDFPTALYQLERVKEIWKLLVQQYDVLETMSSLDFLDFRKYLSPGSGFQSYQFKAIESMLGLSEEIRFSPHNYKNENGPYYKRVDAENGALTQEHSQYITDIENKETLFLVLTDWLKRIPFFNENYWENEKPDDYWKKYSENYYDGLSDRDKQNKQHERLNELLQNGINIRKEVKVPFTESEMEKINAMECSDDEIITKTKFQYINRFDGNCVKAAIFILVNRNLPIFHLPYKFLTLLMDIDELIAMWRYRHLLVVKKIIGERSGTGKTSGADYLQDIVNHNSIFPELKYLSTYLLERNKIPDLPNSLKPLTSFPKMKP